MPRINSSETLDVRGTLDVSSAESVLFKNGAITRPKVQQEAATDYAVPFTDMRVWDDFNALPPGTAAADDLAIIEGTFGTDSETMQTSDAKAGSATQRTRFKFFMPAEYDSGETVTVRVRGGMITTISDTTATVDVECYAHDDDGAVGSDLCTTSAQTINSLTKADKDFTITATSLTPGDVLDIRLTIAITDSATGTAVIGELSKVSLLLDIRG